MSSGHRVGLGHDLHRLEAGVKLFLGGVEIECEVGLAGHSDGDALLHAVTDAVLGACGEGDIGEHFKPGDPRWAGAPSRRFLEEALSRAAARGLVVGNVDTVVITEIPRLSPWKERIRESLAGMLSIPTDRVGVKAKTAEGLGPVGEGRALEARAVVLLVPASD